jgi:hypothetical protein
MRAWLSLPLALLFGAAPAQADLAGDLARLTAEWKEYGKLQGFKPRLLERGDVRPLLVPAAFTDTRAQACTTVAVLGTPSSNFVLRFVPGRAQALFPNGEWPEASVAGAAQIVRCGARKEMLERLVVEMRSPRAVLEVVAVQAPVPLPSLRRTLPHRDPGPIAPLSSGGPPPASAPLEQRGSGIENRNRREGAVEIRRRRLDTGDDGSGDVLLRFERGCHRLDALSMSGPGASLRGVDVDLELTSIDKRQLLAADRTESADATLTICVGEATPLRLRFGGSLPRMPIALLTARWDLPRGLPEEWDPEVRGRMAEAIWHSHNRSLGGRPVSESIGVGGLTALPIEVEPGACYLAAVAPIRGESTGVGLAAAVGRQHAQNHGGPEGAGTTVAFCSAGEERALFEIETRGVGVVWLFAVWQTGQLSIGRVQE